MTVDFLGEAAPTGVLTASNGEASPAVFHLSRERPLVSCLMVSRGNVSLIRHSLNCFIRQTYPNRELVILLQDVSPALQDQLQAVVGLPWPVQVHRVPPSLGLGDLRNMAVARSRGSLICQWDDDDLHHPTYLDTMVGFIEANAVPAAFLDQWTIWWPARRLFALSHHRIWEGSMVARRAAIPIYPNLARGEDAFVTRALVRRGRIVVVRAPHLYVYTVTGQNTWDAGHMMRLVAGEGSARCDEADYDAIFDRLDRLYDVAGYRDYCERTVAGTA